MFSQGKTRSHYKVVLELSSGHYHTVLYIIDPYSSSALISNDIVTINAGQCVPFYGCWHIYLLYQFLDDQRNLLMQTCVIYQRYPQWTAADNCQVRLQIKENSNRCWPNTFFFQGIILELESGQKRLNCCDQPMSACVSFCERKCVRASMSSWVI